MIANTPWTPTNILNLPDKLQVSRMESAGLKSQGLQGFRTSIRSSTLKTLEQETPRRKEEQRTRKGATSKKMEMKGMNNQERELEVLQLKKLCQSSKTAYWT